MNTEALFLFLILLLGIVLCSFLGGKCNREGLTNNNVSVASAVYNGPNGDTATIITNSDGTQSIQLNQSNGSTTVVFTPSPNNSNLFTNPFGFTATLSNGNIIFTTPNNSFSQTLNPQRIIVLLQLLLQHPQYLLLQHPQYLLQLLLHLQLLLQLLLFPVILM